MSRVIRFHRIGGPDVLQIDDVDVPAPGAGEIRLRVKAIGINRAEVMYRTGHYTIAPRFPATLGYEAAGVVEALGPGVAGFAPGDAVSVVPAFSFADYGMYGEQVNVPAHAVVKHPDGLSFEEAAATWMMYVTAYGALIELGGLQHGDAVLIDAGAAHVIVGSGPDLTRDVLRMAGGNGARVAFDPVGGPDAAHQLRALRPHGMFVQYGALDTRDLAVPVMDLLAKHLTLRGYELFEISGDPQRLERAKRFITDGLAAGALKPSIDRTFTFEQIADAHRYMEAGAQVGKIVVTV